MAVHRRPAGRAGPKGLTEPGVVRVRLLGGFEVSVGSRVIGEDGWRLRKAAGVIKLLALAPGHRLHRERAMDLLWPKLDREAAANNLHRTLYAARRVLGSDALRLRDGRILLCPEDPLLVDVQTFENTANTARRGRDPAAYRAALDLYTGDLLPDDLYEGWARDYREGLRGTYLSLLEELAGLYEERGEPEPAIESLRKAAQSDPTREESHLNLMRLYAATGRPHRALEQYERLRQTLENLDAEPGTRSNRLREDILAGRTPHLRTPSPTGPRAAETPGRNNLPVPLTSFVGREREKAEVGRLLDTARLLTLTGTGGCGKTRLALASARELAFPDGTWLVELAALSEAALVPGAVASVLGMRERPGRPPTETLVWALKDKGMLLVLDNCEHLVYACARLVETLLGSCPRLRVLATSRETLGVAGEVSWQVPPLSVPQQRHAPEDLERYESVRLFLERARRRNPTFVLGPRNAGAVAEICAGLDGIPLALELAAARVGTLSVEDISARLDDAPKLLTGGARTASRRQRTLRGALDWSYEMLDESEKRLFARLSVFAGGWTLGAAEAVGAGDGLDEVLDVLELLVDKSLVVAEASEGDASLRYRMLEPVRQYARERLEEGGEAKVLRGSHAAYYLDLAEEAGPELAGRDQAEWLERLAVEHANLRAALGWSLRQANPEPGLRIMSAAWMFWYTRGHLNEGRAWLEKAISLGGAPGTVARALVGAGWISMFQGDYGAARSHFERGLALFRELGDEDGIVVCLTDLGLTAVLGERRDIPVPALLEEATRLRPKLTDPRTIANLLILSGLVAFASGDPEQAWALHQEGLQISREAGNLGGTTVCLTNLGLMAVGRGDYARASALLRENLQLTQRADDKMPLQYALFGLAGVAAADGLPVRAARLWGASEAVREVAGLHLTALARSGTNYEDLLAATRSRLGEAEVARVWAEGKAMLQEEAVEYALSEEVRPREEPAHHILTHREREVAVLVARGSTNRQISSELSISERTAGNHVARILKKLGLRSRAQIATWSTEVELHETDPA